MQKNIKKLVLIFLVLFTTINLISCSDDKSTATVDQQTEEGAEKTTEVKQDAAEKVVEKKCGDTSNDTSKGKCGEGKCGDTSNDTSKGKCGDNMTDKAVDTAEDAETNAKDLIMDASDGTIADGIDASSVTDQAIDTAKDAVKDMAKDGVEEIKEQAVDAAQEKAVDAIKKGDG